MVTSYPRKIGPQADLAELEYVAALHQTSLQGTRTSATISSLDVVRYLRSRHGLVVDHTTQGHDIVRGLGGSEAALLPTIRQSQAKHVARKLQQEQQNAARQQQKSQTHAEKWRRLSKDGNDDDIDDNDQDDNGNVDDDDDDDDDDGGDSQNPYSSNRSIAGGGSFQQEISSTQIHTSKFSPRNQRHSNPHTYPSFHQEISGTQIRTRIQVFAPNHLLV